MIPRMRLIAVALLLAVLAVAPVTRAADDRLAQVHRVAIITAFGDRIEIFAEGWTDKDSGLGYRSIDGWGLSEIAKKTATEVIGNRFQVVPASYDSSRFIVPDTDPPSQDLPPIKTLILSLPPSDVDAYLVIRTRTWHLTAPYVMDGITAMSNALFRSRTLFVTMQVDLVDAKSGRTLSARFLPTRTGISREDWAMTPEQMSDGQAQDLRRLTADLIVRSVTGALKAMGLTGPQVGP